ncbi:MAG: glycosyltransferase family 4 protein [Acidobacteriota bacterium]
MRKVLVIAYYFPPLGLSGVQRTVKFVKYLEQYGWQPTVLTVSHTGYYAKDESMLRELEARNIRIVRADSLDPNRLLRRKSVVKMPSERMRKFLSRISDTFFIPDNKIGWKHAAVKAASALLKEEPHQLIFATAPPQTAFLIGKALKEKFKIPLVIDYRDAWVDYPFKFYPTPIHKFYNYRLERGVLRSADAIVTASRRVKEMILRRYKFLTYNDITIISQGFDPEDMQITDGIPLPATEKMRITYSGTFYEDRNPNYFLEALAQVFKRHPDWHDKIEACFVGTFSAEYGRTVNRLGLTEAVNALGYLDHRQCVKYLLASDVLWVKMIDDKSSPGKIYEYIGTGKKILGCVPEGFMRQTIEEANGICVDPKDIPAIAEAIETLYTDYRNKTLRGADDAVIHKYNRAALTGDLAKIFINLVD